MGMSNFGSEENDNAPLFTEINVTPLVDVMLVLLIIFMVTAPFMSETIGVDLPKGTGEATQGLSSPLTISIDKKEKISIAGQPFSLEELNQFLQSSPRIKNKEPVYIEADQAITHGVFMAVMSSLQKAGADKINVMTEQERLN